MDAVFDQSTNKATEWVDVPQGAKTCLCLIPELDAGTLAFEIAPADGSPAARKATDVDGNINPTAATYTGGSATVHAAKWFNVHGGGKCRLVSSVAQADEVATFLFDLDK
jgi:hypothetical protein